MIKFGLICSVFLFAAGVLNAQTATDGPSSHGTLRHRAQDNELLQTQQASKVSLAQAIEVAESKGPGRAVGAGFKVAGGTAQYEIKLLASDGKLVEHHVDADSGQVVKSEDHPIEAFFTRLKPADLHSARTTLRQAVAAAEEKAGGKASEAEVSRDGNSIRYEVAVVADGRVRRAQVGEDGVAVLAN